MLFGIKTLNRYILKLVCAIINVCPEFTFGRGELKLLNLRQVQLMQQNRLQARAFIAIGVFAAILWSYRLDDMSP